MNKLFVAALLLTSALSATTVHARGLGRAASQPEDKNKVKTCTMYFLGVAKSYIDSTTYFTDIQVIDGVAIDKHGEVMNLEMYSQQLTDHFRQLNQPSYICSIFAERKRKNLERLFVKLKRRVSRDKGTRFGSLSQQTFRYERVAPESVYRNATDKKTDSGQLEDEN